MWDNTNGHRFAGIPADVDEKILKAYLDGSALPPANLATHAEGDDPCFRFINPRHGKQDKCREF
jgi:hypothetical protein